MYVSVILDISQIETMSWQGCLSRSLVPAPLYHMDWRNFTHKRMHTASISNGKTQGFSIHCRVRTFVHRERIWMVSWLLDCKFLRWNHLNHWHRNILSIWALWQLWALACCTGMACSSADKNAQPVILRTRNLKYQNINDLIQKPHIYLACGCSFWPLWPLWACLQSFEQRVTELGTFTWRYGIPVWRAGRSPWWLKEATCCGFTSRWCRWKASKQKTERNWPLPNCSVHVPPPS